LTRALFAWRADAKLADYYERALFNGILSTQDPATGMVMYYVPMESGWYKTFCTPNDSFWCCTGTGVENHAKYGDSIYFHDDNTLYVNLFIASELDWPEKGIRLRQETRFPEEDGTTLALSCRKDVPLDIRVRVPSWAVNGVTVRINGETQDIRANPGTYLSLARTWKNGDRISVQLPMSLSLWRMPDNPKLAAVMYGPLVLAGELPTEDLPKDKTYGPYHAEGVPVSAPDLVTSTEDPAGWVLPVPGQPLIFRTVKTGRPGEVTLVPFYRLFGKRYAIYWHIYNEKEWTQVEAERRAKAAREEARQKDIAARTLDRVQIADPESEKQHGLLSEESSSGSHLGRAWRDASKGGWFSYELKAPPGRPLILLCTYWGGDVGRTFDILVDRAKIATQTVNVNYPGDFFDVEYKIPADLTRNKRRLNIRFQAAPGSMAGGLFGLVLLKQ
jgi:hypothetical protein